MAHLKKTVIFMLFALYEVQSCCFPEKFEGIEVLYGGRVVNGRGVPIQGLYNISVDVTIEKIALSGTTFYDGVTFTEHILVDSNANKIYVVINGACVISSLGENSTTPRCVPSTAKKVMSTYIGIEGSKMDVDLYRYTDLIQNIIMTVAPDDGCIPIAEHQEMRNAINDISFVGLTLGIKDMKVFDIPKECPPSLNGVLLKSILGHMKYRHHHFFIQI